MTNRNRVTPGQRVPGCMTRAEFELWAKANGNAGGNAATTPCVDCPISWLVARVVDHTCDAFATTQRTERTTK